MLWLKVYLLLVAAGLGTANKIPDIEGGTDDASREEYSANQRLNDGGGGAALDAAQIAGALAKAALEGLTAVGWHESKRVRRQWCSVPYAADGRAARMRLAVSEGVVRGLDSLTPEASSFLPKQQLKMRVVFRNLLMGADFQVRVNRVGAAPADAAAGHAQDRISRAWIDAVVNLDSEGLPLNFADFEVDSEDASLIQATNLSGNQYAPIYKAAIKEGLMTLLLDTLRTNVKVKFNQGLQGIKASGNYSQWLKGTS
nr:uncharacterized protein LOC113800819 [Penaeus vannamei]